MKNRFIKISSMFFLIGVLSPLLGACNDGDNVKDLFNKGSSKNPFANVGDNNNKSTKSSGNNNDGSNKGDSSSGSKDYKDEGFSYVYTVGSGECGVYAINNALKGISDIEVPKTYIDKQGNVYQVKYDCNNGFNALEDAKSITFQDGFEKVAVGFGSSMKLEKVVLPSTLKKITCCMLVNCQTFKTIEFKGTMSQWNAVEKLEEWNYMAPSFTVKCSDGNIPVEALQDD